MQSDCMGPTTGGYNWWLFLKDYAPKKEGRGASSSDHCQVGLHTDGCTRLPIHISGGNSDGSLLCIH